MRTTPRLSLIGLIIVPIVSALMTAQAQDAPQKKAPETRLSAKYSKWLNEEVLYIVSQREKEVFLSLRNDEDRENFIHNFWKSKDPTPATPLNEFREEHLRRLEYVKKRYFEGKAGWLTDRGRVYIMFGPPDFFETNPGGGRGFLFDPSGPTAEFPSEVWTYRSIPGLKTRYGRIDFIFIDNYNSGAYTLTTNPGLANALRNVSTSSREAGYETEKGQFPGQNDQNMAQNPIEQLTLLAELSRSRGEVMEELERSARLRKLRGVVEAKESLNSLPFGEQESYFQGKNNLTVIPVSIEVAGKDVLFQKSDDRYQGIVNFHVEIKDRENTVYQTSDRLEMNLREETYGRRMTDFYQYKHRLEIKPGDYSLHLVVWDEFSNKVGYLDKKISVPSYSQSEFSLSEVVLARSVRVVEVKKEPVVLESKDIPALKALEGTNLKVPEKIEIVRPQVDPFTFGNLEINPNPMASYRPKEELVFFYQIYNPTFDAAQNKAGVFIEHQIWKDGQLVTLIDKPQEASIPIEQKPGFLNSGARYTLDQLNPGSYTLLIRVKDKFSDRAIEKKVNFLIK